MFSFWTSRTPILSLSTIFSKPQSKSPLLNSTPRTQELWSVVQSTVKLLFGIWAVLNTVLLKAESQLWQKCLMKRKTKLNRPLLSSSNWSFQILSVHIKTTLLTFSSFQKMSKLTNVSVLLTSNTSLCLAVKMAGSTFGTLGQLLLRSLPGISSALNGLPSNQSTFIEWMAPVKLVYPEYFSSLTKILPPSTVPVMRVIYFRLIGQSSHSVMIIKLQRMSKSSATLSVITAQSLLWKDRPSTTIL